MAYKPNRFMPPHIATAPLQSGSRQSTPREYRNADVCLTCPYPRCKTGECDRIKHKRRKKQ
nr:MAG TPA: hypothetical protein [Caudoviricetes sp.]